MKNLNGVVFTAVIVISITGISSARADKTISLDGYVVHGINVYNNKFIVDYSLASPTIPWLNPATPLTEIGAFNSASGATNASVITKNTSSSAYVATIRTLTDFFGFAVDPLLFNKTLDQIGSNFFGSTGPADRMLIDKYEGASVGVYAAKGVNSKPTVGEWNAIKGRLEYSCHEDGSATVEIGIRNAFPKSLYTMWDVGAFKPQTSQETGYAVPLGGIPNVILTDENGCGRAKVEVPYCPSRSCEVGSDSCSSYISLLYHWDDQVYGADPGATFYGFPAGVIGANHMAWPMSGTALEKPHNGFKGSLSCNSGHE